MFYRHRYSDDLDYFVNDHPDFDRIADRQIAKLNELFGDVRIAHRGAGFLRLYASTEQLKIEMINDMPAHIGDLVKHPVLGIIESRENILSNKITAVIDRGLPKDIADIYVLLHDGLSIRQALLDVDSKAAGTAPLLVAKVLAEFDYSLLVSEIKWITAVPGTAIKQFLNGVARKIIAGDVL